MVKITVRMAERAYLSTADYVLNVNILPTETRFEYATVDAEVGSHYPRMHLARNRQQPPQLLNCRLNFQARM